MAVCQDCGREMLVASGCTVEKVIFPDGVSSRIPFGSEKPAWRTERCGDCGVERGGYHHLGCDIEQCPVCLHQALSCACPNAAEETYHAEDSPWADVPDVIEMISKMIREAPELDPSFDHLFIDPVAACGHVGQGHIRDMTRGDDLPLGEWFELARWMGQDTAAVLFTCRSNDFESVDEMDLNVARRMAVYATENDEISWELVYVTRNGNFRASDLLGLPGHPQFEACTS